jgi:hypothetical protein
MNASTRVHSCNAPCNLVTKLTIIPAAVPNFPLNFLYAALYTYAYILRKKIDWCSCEIKRQEAHLIITLLWFPPTDNMKRSAWAEFDIRLSHFIGVTYDAVNSPVLTVVHS